MKITVFKATHAGNHGSETGWSEALGNGTATFTSSDANGVWGISTGYWIFDGMGSTTQADTTGQGIKVVSTAAPAANVYVIISNGSPAPGCTFKHIEVQGSGYNLGNYGGTGLYSNGNCDSLTIQYCYIHDCNGTMVYLVDAPVGVTIEHTYFRNCGSGNGAAHSQMVTHNGAVADHNFIFRYNTMANMLAMGGTSYIGVGTNNAGPSSGGYDIYGNIFNGTSNASEGPSRTISSDSGDGVSNVNIYNNTFVNLHSSINSGIYIDGIDSVIVKNNLWYDCTTAPLFTGVTIHDKNAAETDLGELNDQLLESDPFTDLAGWDFTLSAETEAGEDQPSPFNKDRLGVTRGDGDIWDRGAYDNNSGVAAVTDLYYKADAVSDGTGTHVSPMKLWATVQAALDTAVTVHIESNWNEPITIDKDSVVVKPLAGVTPVGSGKRQFNGFAAAGTGDSKTDSVSVTGDSFAVYGVTGSFTSVEDTWRAGDITGYRASAVMTFELNLTNFSSLTHAYFVHRSTYTNNGTMNVMFSVPDSSAAVHPTTYASWKAVVDASYADGDSIAWNHAYAYGYYNAGEAYTSPDIAALFSAVPSFDGTGTYHLVIRDGTGSDYRYTGASLEHATIEEAMLYYEYVQTGTAGLYVKAIGDTTWITRMWNNNTLMSKQTAGAALSSNNQWCFSADATPDSVYIFLSEAADIDSLYADVLRNLVTVDAREVTVHGLVLKHASNFGIVITDGLNNVYNCAIDSLPKGVYIYGDSANVKNNVFAVTDTAYTDTGSDSEWDYNAWVTGYKQGSGTHDVLAAGYWITAYTVPPETWRDKGVDVGLSYNGTAPEIGPVELDALTASAWPWDNGAVSRYGQPRPVSRYGRVPAVNRR